MTALGLAARSSAIRYACARLLPAGPYALDGGGDDDSAETLLLQHALAFPAERGDLRRRAGGGTRCAARASGRLRVRAGALGGRDRGIPRAARRIPGGPAEPAAYR